jgi:hypothetical protein
LVCIRWKRDMQCPCQRGRPGGSRETAREASGRRARRRSGSAPEPLVQVRLRTSAGRGLPGVVESRGLEGREGALASGAGSPFRTITWAAENWAVAGPAATAPSATTPPTHRTRCDPFRTSRARGRSAESGAFYPCEGSRCPVPENRERSLRSGPRTGRGGRRSHSRRRLALVDESPLVANPAGRRILRIRSWGAGAGELRA